MNNYLPGGGVGPSLGDFGEVGDFGVGDLSSKIRLGQAGESLVGLLSSCLTGTG